MAAMLKPLLAAQLFASALGAEGVGSCSSAQCSDDEAALLQVASKYFPEEPEVPETKCKKWLSGVPKCLQTSARNLATSLPNVSRWSDDDNEGISGYYVDDGSRDMYDHGNYISFSVEGLGFSSAMEYTQQCDGEWSSSGHGDVEYFTCRVDVDEGTLNFKDHNQSTVWFAGFRSKSGSINGLKIGGELGADGYGKGEVGHTSSSNHGFYGYYSQTVATRDPSVNHLVVVPDSKWTAAYTTNPELKSEGDIYTASGDAKYHVKRGPGVHGLLYLVWGGNDYGIPNPDNTVYTQANFEQALAAITGDC